MIHKIANWDDNKCVIDLTFIYDQHSTSDRKGLWNGLLSLKHQIHGLWMVMGDFNSDYAGDQRKGDNSITEMETSDFVECLNHVELGLMKSFGQFFSWSNGGIETRIDHVFTNIGFLDKYFDQVIHYMLRGLCDHSPLFAQFASVA